MPKEENENMKVAEADAAVKRKREMRNCALRVFSEKGGSEDKTQRRLLRRLTFSHAASRRGYNHPPTSRRIEIY